MKHARHYACGAFAVALASVGILLFVFNPAECSAFPQCPFRLATGFSCPGCGSLRAIHQLLHGNLTGAFLLNPLAICIIPFMLLYLWQDFRAKSGNSFSIHPMLGWVICGVTVMFWVLRNIMPLFGKA